MTTQGRMQNKLILIIAEHLDGKIKPVTYELLACADMIQQFQKMRVRVVLLGDDIEAMAHQLAENLGCDVIAVNCRNLKSYNGEVYKTILTRHRPDSFSPEGASSFDLTLVPPGSEVFEAVEER